MSSRARLRQFSAFRSFGSPLSWVRSHSVKGQALSPEDITDKKCQCQALEATMENSREVLKNLKLYDPAIPLLGIYPDKAIIQIHTHTHTHIMEYSVPSSVQLLSRVQLFAAPWTAALQLPCPSPTPGACSNSCPLSQWCHSTISSSVVPFSSCLQSFPALGCFSISQFFASGGQSIGVSASASVLPMNIQDWFP